jgi:hypothetical protein
MWVNLNAARFELTHAQRPKCNTGQGAFWSLPRNLTKGAVLGDVAYCPLGCVIRRNPLRVSRDRRRCQVKNSWRELPTTISNSTMNMCSSRLVVQV